MAEITQMADLKQDNALISPVECLRDVVRRIEAGKFKANKLIIITLETERDGEEGFYETHCFVSNMRVSEQVAVLMAMVGDMTRTLMGQD